jgi:hypothetical protein
MESPETPREPAPAVAIALLEQAIARHRAPPLAPALVARGLGPYRGYVEMLETMRALVQKGYRPFSIGRSVEGEPLVALHLGREPFSSRHLASAEPRSTLFRTSVILAGVHPNEWIGIETCFALLEQLLAVDLGDRSVIAIPVVNPDGIKRVDRNLRAGRHRFVRHNARGVDLNRNFDERWGKLGLIQRLLRGMFYPGPRPASEPEVEAIAHHLSPCRVERAVSLHSFGGAVLYPLASSTKPIHDEEEHESWAKRIAQAIDARRPYAAKSCARWARGFTAGGLELDWFHTRHGALSLLVECSRGGRGLRPSRLFEPFAWFNPPRLSADASAIATALLPFVRGLGA